MRLVYGAELNLFAASSLNDADTQASVHLNETFGDKGPHLSKQIQQSGIQEKEISNVTRAG